MMTYIAIGILVGFVAVMIWATWYMSNEQQWRRQYRDHGTTEIRG